jgi:hypothetical protein
MPLSPALRARLVRDWLEPVVDEILHVVHHTARTTRYRTAMRQALGLRISHVADACAPRHPAGAAATLGADTRAALLMVLRPVDGDADAIRDYVRAVISGAPLLDLEAAVLRTSSLELLRRFHRLVPGSRAAVKPTLDVVYVMTM